MGRWKLAGVNDHDNSPQEAPGWDMVPEQEHGTGRGEQRTVRGRTGPSTQALAVLRSSHGAVEASGHSG